MYESYYYKQLVKIITCVKYSIDTYHRYILQRYILPLCLRNLASLDYHGDSLNPVFPGPGFLFPTVSPGVSAYFPWCSMVFLGVSCFPSKFDLFPILDFAVLN